MTNLLPPAAKQAIIREYWLRVVTVLFFFLSVILFIVALLQIPTYILLKGQLDGYSQQYKEAQEGQNSLKQAEEKVSATNELSKYLGDNEESIKLSEYLTALEDLNHSNITLESFEAIRDNDGKVKNIKVRGVASDRQSLASFSEAITSTDYFNEANVPISNLAKDKDIAFELNVKPK